MMRRFFMQTLLLMTTVALQAQVFLFDEVNYAPTATTFKLFAPRQAKKVVVRIYQDGMGSKALKTVRMTPAETGDLWTAIVKGDLMGKFYTFDMGKGECPGVFAKAVGVNGQRGAIVNLKDTDPTGWAEDRRPVVKSPADLTIYEMQTGREISRKVPRTD